MKIWHGERTGSLPHAKFHVYRGNVSPLRGEKPIFRPLSKNNAGMAALRAGLPIKIHLETCTKAENFLKIVQTSDPEGQIYGQNSKF